MTSETLTAIEVSAASSVAVERVEKISGYRAVGIVGVEGYAPITVGDKTTAGEQSTTEVYIADLEPLDRYIAALVEARAWLAAGGGVQSRSVVLHEEHGAIDLGGEG